MFVTPVNMSNAQKPAVTVTTQILLSLASTFHLTYATNQTKHHLYATHAVITETVLLIRHSTLLLLHRKNMKRNLLNLVPEST